MSTPTRSFIPYGTQWIADDDVAAVVEALRSPWMTQGPLIEAFEQAIARFCGARYAVAVANGTAALHLAALAAGFGPGDEVITSPITFVASANCILYAGARPVFADIDPMTYCLDPRAVETQLSPATKGLIPVHFAGQPCDMPALHRLAKARGLTVIEDAAHAIGARYVYEGQSHQVGSCAHSDMTVFSFHPVKHITTGEGGVVTTNDPDLYQKLLRLRSHGITRDPALMDAPEGPWYYEMQDLGFNYRITDFQCALGLKQLERLDAFLERRLQIVASYDSAFREEEELIVPHVASGRVSAYHLYVIQLRSLSRLGVFNRLREKHLGVNVHYIPVHMQPYYRRTFGFDNGDFPVAEAYYDRTITLPLYPKMSDNDVAYVIEVVRETLGELQS
ncbi:UDP-4-amino-4-deoxy-L-arabinose--oxoglutarate aminotransferase [compost metagenome]